MADIGLRRTEQHSESSAHFQHGPPAYCYRMAVATRLTRAALTQIDVELEEAASVSGAT
jgi:hypothetical protein